MTDTVVIALGRFLPDARRIAAFLNAEVIEYQAGIFAGVFPKARQIVALMSMGIVVRGIAPLLSDKWTDPAVVVVTPDFLYAVPLVGGHHGANALAKKLAGLGLTPVISTATEATGHDSVEGIADRSGCDIVCRDSTRAVNAGILDGTTKVYAIPGPGVVLAGPDVSILVHRGEYTVGIGCRKGVTDVEVTRAIEEALAEAGIPKDKVMVYATTAKKCNEAGLCNAVAAIPANLIFLDDDTINAQVPATPSRAKKIGLVGVAEPCALAVSKHRELIMRKKVFSKVTIAIAR
ncbi:cobalt-precorrin 5A hydrolase [Methanoregula sp.]|uniref:cobalt-precorrin 5A hydrolase n=1 Tax=Methanoregula sp. TaxID=2052170 RepID=UPI002C4F46F8|nr:cobalt-precorrin 5A hydrolase [Methanoregula sp.]HVP96017.1 cobalt-precorrin 5A hydrolase [Methanoregula sp.]